MDYVIGVAWFLATRLAMVFGVMVGVGALVALLVLFQQAMQQ